MFKFGIEHEVAFVRGKGQFSDFKNTTFDEFSAIVARLPIYQKDYPTLRIGDQKIKVKRWYVEGYERFDELGNLTSFVPKGIEVRNLPKPSISQACSELQKNFRKLIKAAAELGFRPVWVSYNPFNSDLVIEPSLNDFEIRRMQLHPEERTGYLTIYTFGPDLNISMQEMADDSIIDAAKKLTYYSPFIVPFSFSSPFYRRKLWQGYSVRTYIRTGDRHAARGFVLDKTNLIPGNPLVSLARIPSERYRIEFKALDTCFDFRLYAALLALLKGMILDKSLKGRAMMPDKQLHQLSAKHAFHNQAIFRQSSEVLAAAEQALKNDPDIKYLDILKNLLKRRLIPAQLLIDDYKKTGDIMVTLEDSYEKFNI